VSPEASSAVVDDRSNTQSPSALSHVGVTWLLALVPIILLGVLLAVIVGIGPTRMIQGNDAPPVERLAVTRTTLAPGEIRLSVLNDGPDTVTIAQVAVDDAYWAFRVEPESELPHLARATITIPYPWVHGDTHHIRLLTSSGVTFDHEIGVALETPRPTARFFAAFALIGLYVGVVPVAIGLLWYPLMSRMGRGGLDFLLALTIGLLLFLLVDSIVEGLEAADAVPGSYKGIIVFVFGAAAAYLTLETLGASLAARRRDHRATTAGGTSGWVLALLVAIGIGLHNFGEGLAIGSAFTLGELALGTLLIVGFTLHNTTEGLAIVAPVAKSGEPVSIARLVQLGLVGGVPTILGAWLGGFVYTPLLAVLFLALGVGGIAQVTRQILHQTAGQNGLSHYLRQGPAVAGLAVGVLIMYVTGLIVG
jgi:zinc transporter, ZIP family